MAKYLVTGAAGFIASKVCERLLEQGHEVAGLDNLNNAYDVRLKRWRLSQLEPRKGFSFSRVDVCDRKALTEMFSEAERPDAVINLAARAGVRQSLDNPWIYYDANLVGTLNLLELCTRFGVGKFVLASTSSLYGESKVQPFREDMSTDRPLSPYAASKKAAETLAYSYHHLKGLDVTVLRYFTVYGPAGRPDMSLFRFVQWISSGRPVTVFGDGSQSRDFTYVDDISRGTTKGLRPVGFEIFNLGSDQPVVLMNAIRLIEEMVGEKAKIDFQPRHPADVMSTWADIDKSRRMLGWEPQHSFREGVQAMVDWYSANESWASQIETW